MTQKERDLIRSHINRVRHMLDLKYVKDWEDQIRKALCAIEEITVKNAKAEPH